MLLSPSWQGSSTSYTAAAVVVGQGDTAKAERDSHPLRGSRLRDSFGVREAWTARVGLWHRVLPYFSQPIMFGVQQSPVALLLLLLLLRGSALAATGPDLEDFSQIVDGLPPGFMFGTASAAYQASPGVDLYFPK